MALILMYIMCAGRMLELLAQDGNYALVMKIP